MGARTTHALLLVALGLLASGSAQDAGDAPDEPADRRSASCVSAHIPHYFRRLCLHLPRPALFRKLGAAVLTPHVRRICYRHRKLAETAAVAMTPQHSLLLELKAELSDQGDTLASWVPEVGPCEWGEDSFAEGWAFVKCGGGVARELYLVGAINVTGDVTKMLWQLRQSGIAEMHLPPFERVEARPSNPLPEPDEKEEPEGPGEEEEGAGAEAEGEGSP